MTPNEKELGEKLKKTKARIEYVPAEDGHIITCHSKCSIQVRSRKILSTNKNLDVLCRLLRCFSRLAVW